MVAISSALGALSSFASTHATDLLGAVGGIGSFFGNQIGSALSSQRSWKNTKAQMYLSDYLNRQYVKDSYSLLRQSLSKAGYNPLLALGSSGNQAIYSGSAPGTDSDAGDQAVNSAMAMKNFAYQNKLLATQVEGQEKDNEYKDLMNEKLRFENRTNPKKLLTDFIDNGEVKDVNKLVKNVKEKSAEFFGKLPSVPSQDNNVSAKSVVSNKQKAVKLVRDVSKGSKSAKIVLNSVLATPTGRASLVGYLGYKTVRHLINVYHNYNKKEYGHDKGFDFEYIKDKDLK